MTAFFVKCGLCGKLYNSTYTTCLHCGCKRITQRIFWTKADYDEAKRLEQEAVE